MRVLLLMRGAPGVGKTTFIKENNLEQFAMDAAAGEGETLTTLAGIMDMNEADVAAKTYQNFAVLFPNENVDAVDVTLKFYEIMKA